MSELEFLERRLTSVVTQNCNVVGCANCCLKFGGYDSKECAATYLNGMIWDIIMRSEEPPHQKEQPHE